MWDSAQQIIADIYHGDYYEADCYIRGTNLAAKYRYQNAVKSDYTYYIQNAHGDVVNLADSTGAITKTYKYDAFGVEKNIDDSDTNAFRYCGEYYDAETDTVYLRARYYNPTIGRFISRDSFTGKNEDPLSLNLYTYCHNNPIYGIDPSGHITWPGQIHTAVQNYIVYGTPYEDSTSKIIGNPTSKRQLVKEVKIKYGQDAKDHFKKKSGRADVVDKITGEFWEVKSNHSGVGLQQAKFDVEGYTKRGNKYSSRMKLSMNAMDLAKHPNATSVHGTKPIVGDFDEQMNGSFVFKAGLYEYYDVTFWQPEKGIVLYDYKKKQLKPKEVAVETFALLLALGASYFGAGDTGMYPVPAMWRI